MALAQAETGQASNAMVDLAALAAAPLAQDPFDHVIVRGFVPRAALPAIHRDFPPLNEGGSHPLWLLKRGPAFRALARSLRGPEMAAVVGEKFGLDLTGKATMITVRGQSRAKDGRIHTDSRTKILTALIYFNDAWDSEGGRLRLLRQPRDLDDYVVEVPPEAGTLLLFRCTPTAWHGHKPFVGQRRSLQLNWVTSHGVALRETLRHSLSNLTKPLKRARG